MKGFLLILFALLQTTFLTFSTVATSIIPKDPKFCTNCKFSLKENFLTSDMFCKCSKFSYLEDDYFFVNGRGKPQITKYHYCSTARNFDHMCGVEGKKYEEKPKTNFLDNLLQNKK